MVCVVENCEDLPIRFIRSRRAEVPCAIDLRFAHSAVRGGQIYADAILTLFMTTCRLRVLD